MKNGPENPKFDFEKGSQASCASRRTIRIKGRTIGVTPVFFAYWRFAAERQSIFFRRLNKEKRLTTDPVLTQFKFTNAYRASDRVSQFLIRNVVYRDDLPDDPNNLFFRIMLFKLFNKIETWEYLERCFGELTWDAFDVERFDIALTKRMSAGQRIYSAAYIMPSAGTAFGHRLKHQNHLCLIKHLIAQRFPFQLQSATSMAEVYQILLSAPSIGPFLAYQFATDINYSALTNFSESEFVVAGPGAIDGIQKCFIGAGDISSADIISYMYENQAQHFSEQAISFPSLWGRPLQLIDCQNLFCEISKYARVAFPQYEGSAGRTRIKQKFSTISALPDPWYPPKWELNAKIDGPESREVAKVSNGDCRAVQPVF